MKTVVDLSGSWKVVLDHDLSLDAQTCIDSPEACTLTLPGSLDEAGIGLPTNTCRSMQGLSRRRKYVGPAWYFKTVQIPPVVDITRVTILLERCHWESSLFINGSLIGTCNSLSTPHVFDVTGQFITGEIQVVLRVNNAIDLKIGRRGHMVTDWTQTNWNGIIGRMELQIHNGADVVLKSARILESRSAIRISGEVTRYPSSGNVQVTVNGEHCGTVSVQRVGGDRASFEAELSLARQLSGWNEWSPALHLVCVTTDDSGSCDTVTTGGAWMSTDGRHLQLNKSRIYLRGTLECAIFPLTGHPPMNVGSWRELMKIVTSHGLNHIRFHSWCPPDAAFTAADEAGILLQPELPLWVTRNSFAADADVMQWASEEASRIYSAYNHHPSFGLFCLGNELVYRQEEPLVEALLRELKSRHAGRLVTAGAYSHPANPESQVIITCDSGQNHHNSHPLRASSWWELTSRFDREQPCSVTNYDAAMAELEQPVIAHEVGQWVVFPNVHNREDYSGILSAQNFDWIAEMLEQRGMLEQAKDFTYASGKLAAALYKEEVEALLRTANVSGFQLLDLHDFPGQGTATIGVLDAFWRSKGFITSEEFRAFCRPDVPLAQLDQYIFISGTQLTGQSKLAHYGPQRSNPVTLTAQLLKSDGSVICKQNCGTRRLSQSGLVDFENLNLSIPAGLPPCQLLLALSITDEPANTWNIWVYPPSNSTVELHDILVTDSWSYGLANELRRGGTVWLRHQNRQPANALEGQFSSCFWSPVHFKGQAGTTGLLIDSGHPIFAHFPTESYSQWQWWDIVKHSRSMVINDLPQNFRPIVQTIDRFTRNDKLAVMLEAAVGKGRILITAIDFDTDIENRPASRQLEYSVRTYLNSASLNPAPSLSVEDLDTLYLTED